MQAQGKTDPSLAIRFPSIPAHQSVIEYARADGVSSVATFSRCSLHRFYLVRSWDNTKPRLAFIMLNPSKATAEKEDPTVAGCQRRARALGHGSFSVTNIFSYRSTDPFALYHKQVEPTLPENDNWIQAAADEAHTVVVAWGRHGSYRNRQSLVLDFLTSAGTDLMCLGQNKDGSPKHPLYIADAQPLRRYVQTPI